MSKIRQAYKLCWICGKKFRGNFKTEYKTKNGIVYVHKSCKEAEP